MILVDSRTGSSDLMAPLKSLTPDVLLTTLEFGDVAWTGNGPQGPLQLGVEYKSWTDLMDCILDGRFVGHQLPGMVRSYDRSWLLLWGSFRPDMNSGAIQFKKGPNWYSFTRRGRPVQWSDVQHWLMSVQMQTGIMPVHAFNHQEAARWIQAAHDWWAKPWDKHAALKQFHVISAPAAGLVDNHSLVRRCAKELRSIGWNKSEAVDRQFKSLREMANANVQTWRGIEGIGDVLSSRIVDEITGGADVSRK